MPRLIFVNRFYWPDESATAQLLTDLAERLAAQSYEICIITSAFGPPERPGGEQHRGVEIVRVGPRPNRGKHILHRFRDYLAFSMAAVWRLSHMLRRNDVVIFLTDPPLLAIWCHPWLRWRHVRYFHWVQDIYPEIAAKLTGHRWLNLLRPLRNLSWRRAAACVALDQDMAAVIRSAGVPPDKVQLISNWAPAGLQPAPVNAIDTLRRQWNLNGKFVVLYSGNLGRVHDLEPIIAVADRLRENQDIVFAFVGNGAQLPVLQQGARDLGLTNVRFFPPQPREQLGATLAAGDVHFVTLRPGCEGLVFPSKLAGICAIGRPVIAIGPRDSNLIKSVVKHGLGCGFAAGEIPAVADAILRLKSDSQAVATISRQAQCHAIKHDLEHAAMQWSRLINRNPTLADAAISRHSQS